MLNHLFKTLLPPFLYSIFFKLKTRKNGWHGDYKSWEDAKKDCTGYDSSNILEKVRVSLYKVKNGEAVYERDSVLFDEIQYSWPLLAGLMTAAAESEGKLSVLDFGGSLGSSYFQNKKFLDLLQNMRWSIVEQPHFVEMGKRGFEDERLKFYPEIADCCKTENPNVLVLASVIEYLPNPYQMLLELLQYQFEYILFDRTQFSSNDKMRLTVQTVPPSIYKASYPCWLLSKRELYNIMLEHGYDCIEEFTCEEEDTKEYIFRGMIFKRSAL